MADPLSRRHPRTPARSNRPPPQSRSSAAPQLQRPSHPTFPFRLSLFPSPCPSTRAAGPPTLELLTCTPISSAPASLISAGKRRLDFILNAFFSPGKGKKVWESGWKPCFRNGRHLDRGEEGVLGVDLEKGDWSSNFLPSNCYWTIMKRERRDFRGGFDYWNFEEMDWRVFLVWTGIRFGRN